MFWLKAALCMGLIAGFLLSPKLWIGSRLYPLTPVWSALQPVRPPFDYATFVVLLALSAAIVFVTRPAALIAVFLALASAYSLFDQSRWQPWFYQYLLMLAALGLYYANQAGANARDSALHACRLIIAGVYFSSGVHKANPWFVHDTFPWLLEPISKWLPAVVKVRLDSLGFAGPFGEVFIGLGLLSKKCRTVAVIAALAMHVLILASIGPLGHNYDTVIWPWNLAMGSFVLLLFWPDRTAPWGWEIWKPKTAFQSLILILFWIAPALSLLDLWDGYPSFALYSGNNNVASIYMADSVAGRLPDEIQEFITENNSEVDELDLMEWSFGELHVPPYAELRVFRNIGKQVCAAAGNPPQMVLVVERKATLFRRKSQFAADCKVLSK